MSIFKKSIPHAPLLLLPLALLAGMQGGWMRMGAGGPWPSLAAGHALLMIGGFLGTLISLERSMAMPTKSWRLLPLINALSIIPLLLNQFGWAVGMQSVTAAGLSLLLYTMLKKHNSVTLLFMTFGALLWLIGNLVFLYRGWVVVAVPWWMGFLLLTIVGERLELSKFLPTPRWAFRSLNLLLMAWTGTLLLPFHGSWAWITGLVMILLACWLLYFDLARIIIRKTDRYRYIGVGLRTGYLWLMLHGLSFFLPDSLPYRYDLYLHTFFLGFVFSMIWAHAPIILPLLVGSNRNPYHPFLWLPWSIFQLSLLLRLLAYVLDAPSWRLIFAQINGYCILLLLLSMVFLLFRRSNIQQDQPSDHLHFP
jgi:hypothetical protein